MPDGHNSSDTIDTRIDTILVALDGSLTSQHIVNLAATIAKKQRLPIRGVYIVDANTVLDPYANTQTELENPEPFASRSDLLKQLEAQGERELTWLIDVCRAFDVAVTTTLEFGSVADIILREAEQASLLVLGRRGHGHGADPRHLGRCFRKIAHHTRVPLLVGGDERHSVLRLLLAYNGSQRAQRALDWTTHLQRLFAAEVIVMAVQENGSAPAQWLEDAQARLAQVDGARYRFLQSSGEPAAEIVRGAALYQVDLIVMGGYRHTTAVEWLVGSTTDQVLRTSPLPVLIT